MVPRHPRRAPQVARDDDLKSFDLTHLYAAWDFSVISSGGTSNTKFSDDDLADPALTMRDQAFKLVGSSTPVFRVTQHRHGRDRVPGLGSFQVPTFLTHCPKTQAAQFDSTDTAYCGAMNVDKHGLPLLERSTLSKGTWSNQLWADFICVMPHVDPVRGAGAADPLRPRPARRRDRGRGLPSWRGSRPT